MATLDGMSDFENWSPEQESTGIWQYEDENGEAVMVPDDECEHTEEGTE